MRLFVLQKRRRGQVFDILEALGGKKDGCLLGEPTRGRPVLLGPAAPRRPAVCRLAPIRPDPFRQVN